MPAERMPPPKSPHESWVAIALEWIARKITRAPKAVLLAGIAVAIVAVFAAATSMGFKTSRLDLLNPNSGFNQRWLAYLSEFGDKDDAIVVVEGPSQSAVTDAIDGIFQEVSQSKRPFEAVFHQRDLARVKEKGLHFLQDTDLQQVQMLLEKLQPVLQGDWSQLNAGRFLRELNQQIVAGSQNGGGTDMKSAQATLEAAIARFGESLNSALQESPEYRSPFSELGQLTERFAQFNRQYLLENDGRRGFLLLRFKEQGKKMVANGEAITELREILAAVGRQHPTTQIGLTGMPVLEYDEMCSSQTDMTIASLVSLVGIIGLLLAGFGSVRYAMLAIATLIVGMCWSFGFITISVGHLNLLSVSFAAILIGLGIDFGIHYLARYLQLRNEGQNCEDSLAKTASAIGPGIITGAVTTAFAFFTAGLTDFTGVAELGIIAGAGILLCLAGAFWILPAMIAWMDASRPHAKLAVTFPLDGMLRVMSHYPLLPIAAVLAFTVAVSPGVFKIRYDHNLLNLQPRHLESVELEKRLITNSDRSVWFAVSMAGSREELTARKAAFEKLPSVDRTEEISSLLPISSRAKQSLIADIQKRLASLPTEPPVIPVAGFKELDEELGKLEMILGYMGPSAQNSLAHVNQLRIQLRKVPEAALSARLSDHQQRAARELLEHLLALRALSDPMEPTWHDVPTSLVTRFVGRNGQQLLRVYARGDIWDMDALTQFVRDVESVDPKVTGHPIQTFYASRQMQFSYIHAAIYSLLALLIVLMLDFKSITHSLLALAPLALAVWQLFGVLGMLGIPFNAANMIVLPLILGIGIDNGVHVIHDWRCGRKGSFQLTNSIAVSMVLCSSTTMVGFCSMIFAKHQGLRSLGQVLTLGVFLCLSTSIFFLPSLLSLMGGRKNELSDESQVEAEATAVSPAETPEPAADQLAPPVVTDTPSRRSRRSARLRSRQALRADA